MSDKNTTCKNLSLLKDVTATKMKILEAIEKNSDGKDKGEEKDGDKDDDKDDDEDKENNLSDKQKKFLQKIERFVSLNT